MRLLSLVLFFSLLSPATAGAATCAGADPAITSVKVANVSTSGRVNSYTLVATVTNLGSEKQASNVLQFVDIFTAGQRLNDRGIPPLDAGQSYQVSYVWHRNTSAGTGSTTMRFHLRMVQPSGSSEDCNTGNDTYTIRF